MSQHHDTTRKMGLPSRWASAERPRVPWPMMALLLATLFAPAVVVAQLPSWRDAADGQAAGRDERYRQGQQALDESRFEDAANLFSAVADHGGADSDAARYWQAWAEWKGGNASGAKRALARLHKDHAGSAWLDDAESLSAEIRARRPGRSDEAEDSSPDALKLYALNSLMNTDAPEAVDAVVRLLERTDDAKLRDRALFVLGQSESPRAAEILADIARGNRAPDLQRNAVRFLGMSDNDANLQLLESIYDATSDADIKAAVIEAYFLADDKTRLSKLAEGEADRSLRLEAIQKLGLTGGTDTLHALYAGADVETKRTILHALFLADDSAFLAQVARTERDPKLRQSAIHNLGLTGDGAALRGLFEASSDTETKSEILHALFLADDGEFLAQVARTERDPKLRQAAIHSLGLTGGADALRDLYGSAEDPKTRDAILHSLFLADDAAGLVSIARGSNDPAERRAVVEQLSLMDDEQALAYLLEILEE